GVFELGHRRPALGAVDPAGGGELRRQVLALGEAVVLGLHLAGTFDNLDVAAADDPRLPHARQPLLDVDASGRIRVGTGGVVDGHRRLAGAGVHGDLAERHTDVRPDDARLIDLTR